MSITCLKPLSGTRCGMPVYKGQIGERIVDVLRDTGCSGDVVRRDLDDGGVQLIDNTARKAPSEKISVDTPYFKGEVEAQCLPDAIYGLIIQWQCRGCLSR